jgi:hypothetical protein
MSRKNTIYSVKKCLGRRNGGKEGRGLKDRGLRSEDGRQKEECGFRNGKWGIRND